MENPSMSPPLSPLEEALVTEIRDSRDRVEHNLNAINDGLKQSLDKLKAIVPDKELAGPPDSD